jgi:predicted HTH domain antitoxin
MALETVTTRLPQKTLEEIESIAERERVDRSELIRRLLDAALQQRRIDEAVKAYGEGKVTLWKASEMAGLSLREMMDIVKEKKIPIPYTQDDLNRDIEYVKRRASSEQ